MLIIFGAVVVPLSCFDLTEQISIQVIMFSLRFCIIILLLCGTVAAIFVDPYDNDNNSVLLSDATYPYWSDDIPWVNFAGFGPMFSTALFSQLFQHSVPGLIRPLSQEEKAEVPSVFGKALLTTCVVYVTLGIVTVSYFGSLIKESISLNFVGFSWGQNFARIGKEFSSINFILNNKRNLSSVL